MGKGNTTKPPVPRRRTREIQGGGGSGSTPLPSPCAQTVEIAVQLTQAHGVAVGEPVTLGHGSPPTLLLHGRRVGYVGDFDAPEIEGCLALQFHFQGSVVSVGEGGSAVVRVTGAKVD